MNFMRVIENARRCMQRVGFLKYLTWRCSLTSATSVDIIGKDLINVVTKKIPGQMNEELKEYILKRLKGSSHKDLREIAKRFEDAKSENLQIRAEIQDIYLSSKMLPSNTGKLSFDEWWEYPNLVSSLGLARGKTYSLLVRGKVFLNMVSKNELESFTKYEPKINPFFVSEEQKIFLLYCFIESDGDVLKRLYNSLLKRSEFSHKEAGELLPEIYREIANIYRNKVKSGVDSDKVEKLLKSASKIEGWKNRPFTGGGGALQESIVVRLEPFVDLGLLEKPDPYSYGYSINDTGRLLFETFCSRDIGIDTFLDNLFFETLNRSFGLQGISADNHEILDSVYNSFVRIKSPLGYAPIKEVALLSAIKSLVNENKYFEIGKATDLIMEYQKSHPYAVRFQVDRSGAPVHVKFVGEWSNEHLRERG